MLGFVSMTLAYNRTNRLLPAAIRLVLPANTIIPTRF